MMPAIVNGVKTQVIPQSEESGSMDRYGVDIITRVECVPKSGFPALLRSKYSTHPRFGSMGLSRSEWSLDRSGQFYRVTYVYEGFLLSLPEAVYSLSADVSEEPIELHPEFEDFAGKPSAPVNGSIFIDPNTQQITEDDEIGVFREFAAVIDGVANIKAGIESYLSPGATWQEIYFSSSTPSGMGSLGEIDSPSGPNPSVSGRNWLYYGMEYTRRGAIYEIRKTWILSGRNGWDEDIYQ